MRKKISVKKGVTMLSKMSIKQKLILIMSIPLCVVILLAAKLGYDSYKYNDNLNN